MSDTCIRKIESYWKNKTTVSNELFQKGKFKDALLGYKNALYRVEVLNKNYSDCIRIGIPLIQIFMISCNNIANTYLELQQIDNAENILKRAIYYLIYTTRNEDINKEEIYTELRKASINYFHFAKQYDSVIKEQVLKDLDHFFLKDTPSSLL
ncbi:hypothetical protein [Tenacibaculum maritimum]|uniref:hypothetical protein n=1 Tax=Tenacibaculum maritimum TaxID=107401 RepID=UPI0004019579|nr:hypothetical protein [Tenacibaculum maritimum]CAA0150110.1 conserved hypothetical protein [Tenacibaculum maritimum]CAA0186068.1 conserved hypothetical protein [Tenacibaculum maritimum]